MKNLMITILLLLPIMSGCEQKTCTSCEANRQTLNDRWQQTFLSSHISHIQVIDFSKSNPEPLKLEISTTDALGKHSKNKMKAGDTLTYSGPNVNCTYTLKTVGGRLAVFDYVSHYHHGVVMEEAKGTVEIHYTK